MLWLRHDIAVNHPCAVDKMLVSTGLAKSLTEARRLIAEGAVCVNNKKLIPPEKGFLPVALIDQDIPLDEYISWGTGERGSSGD